MSPPQARLWGLNLATTLKSKRHRILIALLIERRKAAAMTQAQLADRLGKSRSFIARLESGHRRVYVVELLKLAEVLGFDAGKVVGKVRKVS
jgi:transcriptional regulator with XRE-family HTH domain